VFLPMTRDEMNSRGWDELDIILVTGDAYIDSPLIGVALIGKLLERSGFRVGIIAQPDLEGDDISRLGEPVLFWGVTGGSVDSLVANTTALKKRRRDDDYTPGGKNDRRPDRAAIKYTNLIRRHFKGTVPIVLGGLEASLRRIAHYDYWSNSIRRSILFDAKADYLIYGMAESTVIELAEILRDGSSVDSLRGICRIVKKPPEDAIQLPAYEMVSNDKAQFTEMFRTFYLNTDPLSAKPLAQAHGDRWLLQHSPAKNLTEAELDTIYELEFEREAHPHELARGEIRALETIRFSLATHRGCYGECNFCAIAVHQGRTVQSRSRESITREAASFKDHPEFKGNIYLGGSPTGNMYGFECKRKWTKGSCLDKRCMTPELCETMPVTHDPQLKLLKELRSIEKVKRVFVTSGIRYDLILDDKTHGGKYLDALIDHHVSGQMKVAPEHIEDHVLEMMGKPRREVLDEFYDRFQESVKRSGKPLFMTYYLIAAHPGCSNEDMESLREYSRKKLRISPEQVQIFTPLPSTWSAVMYWTESDPFTGKLIHVEKDMQRKQRQKELLVGKRSDPRLKSRGQSELKKNRSRKR